MSILVIAAGGTFDKRYDEIRGELSFGESHLPQVLQDCRITSPHRLQVLPLLDSLDMVDADRERIAQACAGAAETAIVVVHGTDTMQLTAQTLARAQLAKTIVLTGAMIPLDIAHSDALFNFGYALGLAQHMPAGVYVAMNGTAFDWNRVRKNRNTGYFEAIR
jgi:L-asparaginase